MNITKILFSVIAAIMIVTNTNATTMCVTNDNTNIILDPSIEGTEHTQNEEAKTWTTTFPYGTVSGIAACNSTIGRYATASPEYNFDNNYANSEGIYCWCRMTSPVRSAWVLLTTTNSVSECVRYCAMSCGSSVQKTPGYRNGFFEAAGM